MQKFWDISKIVSMVKKAGALALEMQDGIGHELKSDQSIVTEADKKVQDYLTTHLDALSEKVSEEQGVDPPLLIGEETIENFNGDYIHTAISYGSWVIDPIDGTALYAHGLGGWGVSLGLLWESQIREGILFFPREQIGYVSDRGKVFSFTSESDALIPFRAKRTDPHMKGLVAVSQAIAKYGNYLGSQTVLSTASFVSAVMGLLNSNIQAYITRSKLWDIAGSWPILEALDFQAISMEGVPFNGLVDSLHWNLSPESKDSLRLLRHVVFCPSNLDPNVFLESVKLRS
jgi:myo-inositol-1(or 4)-monophosphatase